MVFGDVIRSVGNLHKPAPGSVSPALVHVSQVLRNKSSESSSSAFEAVFSQNSDCHLCPMYAAVTNEKKGVFVKGTSGKV